MPIWTPRFQHPGAIDRERQIEALRVDGMTYKAIGERFDISRERVRQILKRRERKINQIS
jgi:DNA-binding CsgD family transcriptional regulator